MMEASARSQEGSDPADGEEGENQEVFSVCL